MTSISLKTFIEINVVITRHTNVLQGYFVVKGKLYRRSSVPIVPVAILMS